MRSAGFRIASRSIVRLDNPSARIRRDRVVSALLRSCGYNDFGGQCRGAVARGSNKYGKVRKERGRHSLCI